MDGIENATLVWLEPDGTMGHEDVRFDEDGNLWILDVCYAPQD